MSASPAPIPPAEIAANINATTTCHRYRSIRLAYGQKASFISDQHSARDRPSHCFHRRNTAASSASSPPTACATSPAGTGMTLSRRWCWGVECGAWSVERRAWRVAIAMQTEQ